MLTCTDYDNLAVKHRGEISAALARGGSEIVAIEDVAAEIAFNTGIVTSELSLLAAYHRTKDRRQLAKNKLKGGVE